MRKTKRKDKHFNHNINMLKKTMTAVLALLGLGAVQTKAAPVILTSPVYYELYDISPNGVWACGCYSDYSYNYYGFRWNLETNEIEMLSTSEESVAWSIADDGTVAGTFVDDEVLTTGVPVDMAGYYKDGKWHHVELPAGTIESGQGYGISTDGHYMSGFVNVNGIYTPILWKDGKIYKNFSDGLDGLPWCIAPDGQSMAGWGYPTTYGNRANMLWDVATGKKIQLNDCETMWCGVKNYSPDGKKLTFWGGYKSYAAKDDPQVASIYDIATGDISYITTPGDVGIYVYDITNNGTVLGGKEFDAGGFFWKDSTFYDAQQYMEKLGVDFSNISLYNAAEDTTASSETTPVSAIFRAAAISEDENRVGLMYYDAEGYNRSMVVLLDAEEGLTAPVGVKAEQMQDINAVSITWKQSTTANVEPKGYNVYRDGVKVNSELITEQKYYDNVQNAGTYTYTVEAVGDDATTKTSRTASCTVTEKTTAVAKAPYAHQKGINGVRLQWTAPASNYINRSYTDIATADVQGFGAGSAATAFEVGVGFEKEDLAMYAGNKIRKVQFYPMDATVSGYKLNLYTYDENDALKLIASQNITQELTMNTLNTITLDSPVSLPDGDLIVAIEVPTVSSNSVIGMDYGQCTTGYSDLLRQTTEADFYSANNSATAQGASFYASWLINVLLAPDNAPENADVLDHYTVLVDGTEVGTTKDLSYTIEHLTNGTHELGVKATFATGETSPASTTNATISAKGIDDLMAALTLGATDSTAVNLTWAAPNKNDSTCIAYCSGYSQTGPVGPSDNNYGFMAGVIYTAKKIKGYDGYLANSVRFMPTAEAIFTLSIFQDGEQICEQEIDEYDLYQWNTIALDKPFNIQEGSEYQIVIDCYDVDANKAPLAIDQKPAYDNYSNIYSLDGESWSSISTTGKTGNWMIGLNVCDPTITSEVAALGYDVYIDGEKVNDEMLTTTAYTHDFLTTDTKTHNARVDVYYDGSTLGTQAVTEKVEGTATYFTFKLLAGIDAPTTSKLTLRQGDNFLRIDDANVSAIEAFNAAGMKVAHSNSAELNISGLTPGIYVIKAKTGKDTITRKIEVSK